ncbi:MAG: 4Fe-4S binding protein [Rikenellaceae bacterium]
MERIRYIINLAIITLLFAAVAIQRDGRIFYDSWSSSEESVDIDPADVEEYLSDGVTIYKSATIARDITGYGGTTPLQIYTRNGVVEKIVAEPNMETPSFMEQVVNESFLSRWDGMTLADAATAEIDGVSGATFTSESIISTVQRTAQYGAKVSAEPRNLLRGLGLKGFAALLVIALGAFMSLAKMHNKRLMTLQMVLNVVVLGFWCGNFLSLSTFVSWAANGFNLAVSLTTVVLFIVILIMPLFRRKEVYCSLYCPLGAAQMLMFRVPAKKLRIKRGVLDILSKVRYIILATLLFMMWLGVGFNIINYELFSAFIINSASTVVLILAALFLILSMFVARPYCRFICPTGALLTLSQKTKN